MRGVDEEDEIVDVTVVGMDPQKVGDVIPIVQIGRGIHRQNPDAIDSEIANVVEFLGKSAKVTLAIAIGVVKRAYRNFIKNGVFEPKGVVRWHTAALLLWGMTGIELVMGRIVELFVVQRRQSIRSGIGVDIIDMLPAAEMDDV